MENYQAMDKTDKNPIRYSLGALLIILAVNAFGGGYYGMAGAEGVPIEWLNGSPFPNYFIPGLFLFYLWADQHLLLPFLFSKILELPAQPH